MHPDKIIVQKQKYFKLVKQLEKQVCILKKYINLLFDIINKIFKFYSIS